MDLTTLTITEWIAVITFVAGLIFGFSKFYALFTKMDSTLKDLKKTIQEVEKSHAEYSTRLARIEEQIKTLFKSIGGVK
jgi:Sec-independent protein translocase protein TatA